MPTHSGPHVMEDNPVLHLDAADRNSYPGTGTTWYDLSGKGNDAALVNGPTFDPTNRGSVVFDGTNNSVNFPFDLRQDFTFECWALHDVVDEFSFLGQGTRDNQKGLHIVFRSSSRIRYGMYYNDTDFDVGQTLTGKWYHYCFTYNDETFEKQVYRDGVQIVGTPLQDQISYEGTGDVRIGATYSDGINNAYYTFANGRFSYAKLYTKVLSASEIKRNYNKTKARLKF